MKRSHLAVLLAVTLLGGATLQAQGSTNGKKPSPQHDSLKTVKKVIKTDKAALKAAKKSGDTTTAKSLKKQLKAEKKTKAGLKGDSTKATSKKKP